MKTELKGLNNLIKQLEAMGKSIEGEDIQPILKIAAAPIVSAMQGKVRRRTGRLANSIKIMPFNPKYPNSLLIGPDFKVGGGTMSIAALSSIQEFGAKERVPKKSKGKNGNFRKVLINGEWRTMSFSAPFKAIPAHPFIRPVYDMMNEQASEVIKKGLIELVNLKAKQNNLK